MEFNTPLSYMVVLGRCYLFYAFGCTFAFSFFLFIRKRACLRVNFFCEWYSLSLCDYFARSMSWRGPPKKPDLDTTNPSFEQVFTETGLIFCWLTSHYQFIDTGQKCISASTNCVQQQANELGKCERTRRNCIDGLQQYRVRVQQSFFHDKQVYC